MLALITYFLFVLTGWMNAEPLVIGSPQPIIAVAGDDVILPCSLEPPISAEEMTVVWSRPDLDTKHVHVYRGGRNLVSHQNPSYKYRTSLFDGELIKGNVSLKLFRVKLEDQGNYTCFIPPYSWVKEVVIQLIIFAASEPKITKLGTNNTGVVLQCESEGWYPEPQLDWREGPKDSEGRLLSAKDPQTYSEPDGRYTVRSSVTVQKTDTNMFTCRVQLMKINLKTEAEIHVPGYLFRLTEPSSDPSLVVGVGVSVGVVVLVILGAAVFCYCHCQKKSTQSAGSNDEDPEKEEHNQHKQDRKYPSVSDETHAEIKRCLLRGLEVPDTHKTIRGSGEGEDSGWASKAASNANSTRASLVLED